MSIQRLRYQVFVAELGANGATVDHETRTEADGYDAHSDHLMLEDPERDASLVGVYRLMTRAQAGGSAFSSASEFDLSPLFRTDMPLLELSRACLHRDYRGGMAMHRLWAGLASYVERTGIRVLFGAASFRGTDATALAEPLQLLHRDHLAPMHLRPVAHGPGAVDVNRAGTIDRKRSVRQMPALIKAYLRLGGGIGQGACVDHAFGTTDVCMVLDVAQLSDRRRAGIGARS